MDFIENTLKSLHTSWYAMDLFTVIPMIQSIPRQLSFVYLVAYALSGACVVLYAIPTERPRCDRVDLKSRMMMDEKTHIFRAIKLQEL